LGYELKPEHNNTQGLVNGGQSVAINYRMAPGDTTRLELPFTAPLAAGAYAVEWYVARPNDKTGNSKSTPEWSGDKRFDRILVWDVSKWNVLPGATIDERSHFMTDILIIAKTMSTSKDRSKWIAHALIAGLFDPDIHLRVQALDALYDFRDDSLIIALLRDAIEQRPNEFSLLRELVTLSDVPEEAGQWLVSLFSDLQTTGPSVIGKPNAHKGSKPPDQSESTTLQPNASDAIELTTNLGTVRDAASSDSVEKPPSHIDEPQRSPETPTSYYVLSHERYKPPPEQNKVHVEIRHDIVTLKYGNGRVCVSPTDFPSSTKLRAALNESFDAYGEALFGGIFRDEVADNAGAGNSTLRGSVEATKDRGEPIRFELHFPPTAGTNGSSSLAVHRWEYLKDPKY
jgi:hypothetical protein